MTPDETHHLLAAYADEQLDADDRRRAESILSRDPSARAAVAAHRQLRRGVRRALDDASPPAGLQARVAAALREQPPAPAAASSRASPARRLRLVFPGAIAAALLLAISTWAFLRDMRVAIDAGALAGIHQKCAVAFRHDTLALRDAPVRQRSAQVIAGAAGWAAATPMLASGFEADGACTCTPNTGLRCVHVYFRRPGAADLVVSAFVLDSAVKLGRPSAPAPCGPVASKRSYSATSEAGVQIIQWNENADGFALASASVDAQALLDMAESLSATALRDASAQGVAVALTP